MNGLDPTDVRARELATAEKKSHSARVAHKRRKDEREATLRLHTSGSPPTSRYTIYAPGGPMVDLHESSKRKAPNPKPTKRKSRSVGKSPSISEDNNASDIECLSHTTSVNDISPGSSIVRQPHTNVYLAFNNERWMQAFQFYLNVSGPLIAKCHSLRAGESYTKIIPQMAVSSLPIRHMLLAHAYSHTRLLNDRHHDAKKPNTQSLYHYSKSLESMRTESNRIEILAASILGYIFEVNHNNLHTAVMHLKGFRAIVRMCAGSQTEHFRRLTADYMFAHKLASTRSQGVGETHKDGMFLSVNATGWSLTSQVHETIMTGNSMPDVLPEQLPSEGCLNNIEQARYTLEMIMTDIGDSFPLMAAAKRRDVGGLLSMWIDKMLEWDWQQEHSAKKSGLLWLFTLATSLLPEYNAGHLYRLTESHLHNYIVKDRYVQEQVCAEDVVYITQVMSTSAKHTVKYLQLPEYQRRMKLSLDYVECSKPHRVLCRAWVAAKHVYYHVMCAEDPSKAYDSKGFLSPTGQGEVYETKDTTA